VIALSAVDQLRAIGAVAPELLDAVIAYIDDGNAWAGERLAREPGWVLDAAMRETGDKTFAAHLESALAGDRRPAAWQEGGGAVRGGGEVASGTRPLRLRAAADPVHRGRVDHARAAGVLIEFERGRPIIVDRSLYRELVKGAIKRTDDELQPKAAAAAQEKKARDRARRQPTRSPPPSASGTRSCGSSPTGRTAPTWTSASR
jgi:hypothetical protein